MIEQDNSWWVDSGTTKHVCIDKNQFKKLEPTEDEDYLYMGNSAKAVVKGKGTVDL